MHSSLIITQTFRFQTDRVNHRQSVTLVDQKHRLEILETSSLFVAHRPSTYSQENMEKFWGD